MSTDINWAPLVSKGRAKAPGIPWSDEERLALQSGISPDDVRAGILSKEQLEQEEASGEKKLERLSKAELIDKATALGIDFDANAVTKADLVLQIQQAEEKAE